MKTLTSQSTISPAPPSYELDEEENFLIRAPTAILTSQFTGRTNATVTPLP